MEIKEGDKVKMKKAPISCNCNFCKEMAGGIFTFSEWVSSNSFYVKESDQHLFYSNIEKVISKLPEELFEM